MVYIYSTRSLLVKHITELNQCCVILIRNSKQKSGARLLTRTVFQYLSTRTESANNYNEYKDCQGVKYFVFPIKSPVTWHFLSIR
jgi:hypothetical protein